MAQPQRPGFITFVSWALLIQSVLLLVVLGAALMSGGRVTDDMILPTAATVGGALSGLIIACGLSSMQRWAAYAFILTFCLKFAERALPQFATPPTPGAIDWQNNNIVTIVQAGVCIGMLMYQHQMKATSIATSVTAIGAALLCLIGIPVGALVITKKDLNVAATGSSTTTVAPTATAPTPTPTPAPVASTPAPQTAIAPAPVEQPAPPQKFDEHFNAGKEALRNLQLEKAVAEFTKSLSIDAKNPITYYRRGDCYYRLGKVHDRPQDLRRAKADFRKASALWETTGRHDLSIKADKAAEKTDAALAELKSK